MKFIIFLFAFSFSFLSFSQNPSILWQKTIGGGGDDGLSRYDDPSDDGYFFIGNSNSNISSDKTENSRGGNDIWIVKTDANYNILWDKTIGGSLQDYLNSVLIKNNFIYILSDSYSGISGEKTMNSFGTDDLWLIVCNLNGTIIWQNQYGGSLAEFNGNLVELTNENILITAMSLSSISGNKTENSIGGSDFWVIEINPLNGAIIQQKTIGSINDDVLAFTALSYDGTILIKGGAAEGISGNKTDLGYGLEDVWIVEIDQNFNIIRDKCFGGSSYEFGYAGTISTDGNNYFIVCTSSSPVSGNKTAINQGSFDGGNYWDYWIIKTDSDFNIIWDKTYGGTNNDLAGSIERHEWNKFVVSGWSTSNISGNKTSPHYGEEDAWLLILNENGDLITQETYGGSNKDIVGYQKISGSATNLFFSSKSLSGISGNKILPSKGGADCWFMELDASDFLNTDEITDSETKISVYPNPFNDVVNFKFTDLSENVTVRFYTTDGKLIEEEIIQKGTQNFVWKTQLKSEFVFYELEGETINYRGKLIKL